MHAYACPRNGSAAFAQREFDRCHRGNRSVAPGAEGRAQACQRRARQRLSLTSVNAPAALSLDGSRADGLLRERACFEPRRRASERHPLPSPAHRRPTSTLRLPSVVRRADASRGGPTMAADPRQPTTSLSVPPAIDPQSALADFAGGSRAGVEVPPLIPARPPQANKYPFAARNNPAAAGATGPDAAGPHRAPKPARTGRARGYLAAGWTTQLLA